MGNIDTAVGRAFHSTEYSGAGRGSGQTYVQIRSECSGLSLDVLNVIDISGNCFGALIDVIQAVLLQQLIKKNQIN